MGLPQKLVGASEEKRVKHAVDLLIDRMNFDPNKRYDLMKRVEHDWPEKRSPGNGLLRMDEHWEKVKPLRKIHFPRKKHASRKKTSIEELRSKDDLEEWFQENLGDLEPGVYGILQRQGNSHGNIPMFVVRWNGAEFSGWKRKSSSQQKAGVGERSSYMGFPYYFMHLERVGVTKEEN